MREERHFETLTRHPDWREFIAQDLLLAVLAAALAIIGGLEGVPYPSLFTCLALAVAFMAYYRWVYLRSTLYIITAEQIIWEHGVFSRSRDYVELYRVVDYDERRSFMQMLLGIKTVVVHSTDRTTPCLRMAGIRRQEDLVGTLRERVSYNRQRMNIHEIANYN